MVFLKKQAYQDLMRPEPEGTKPTLTKLICTLGPASESPEVLQDLLEHGMRGVRIQLNSASLDWAKATLKNLQAAQRACGAFASVVLETVGPELAVKAPEDTKEITFEPGTPVTLTRDTRKAFSASVVPVHCEAAFTSLQLKRDAILRVSTFLAAGDEMTALTLAVDTITKDEIECTVQEPCTLPAHADMTMHGSAVHSKLPILRESDKAALAELCALGVHYVCLSYCRSAADVTTVRRFLDERGHKTVKLFAKMCTPEAVHNRREIVEAADGVLVARGTLGLELRPEKVFLATKGVLKACNLAGKVAAVSQVVDTMVHAPRPTRAEATDVANLVLDGTDGILLGDETSKGSNPRGAVATVAAICRQAEVCYDSQAFYARLMDEHGGFREAKLSKTEALASSAVRATTKLGATMVLAFTKTGRTARLLAKYRTSVPILTVVAQGDNAHAAGDATLIAHQCALLRGVIPVLATATCSTGPMATDGSLTDWALRTAMKMDLADAGDRVVVSQCPRVLTDGTFEEAAVVKFVVAGAGSMRELGRFGSCMDMSKLAEAAGQGSTDQHEE